MQRHYGGILLLILLAAGGLFAAWLNLPGPAPRADVRLGMTFSGRYASDLGLDWREAYVAHLDELGVRKLRLPVYWDLVERQEGEYDFNDLDWQLAEAEKRQAEVILVVGQRVPRWPECHIPAWALTDTEKRRGALLRTIQATVERYRNHAAVTVWQVENEPFLTRFGICPPLDVALLESEVALVKALDPARPVMLTDSGELSLWIQAAERGDRFGTTLYRHIYKHGLGYVTYPVGPNFFKLKEALVRLLTDQEHFTVIELQAEPWASGWIGEVPLAEQWRTMDAAKLRENVEYAQRVGFQDIYLWGGEWWYWLREKQGVPDLWETGRSLFEQYGRP